MTRTSFLLAALALGGACSITRSTILADRAGVAGKKPVEVEVRFTGNASIGSTALRARIVDYMLDLSRDPTREAAVYDAALEVEDFYRSLGYTVAKVEYAYSPPAEDADWPALIVVELNVVEGPLVTVEMQLVGNVAYDTDQLLLLWSRNRSGALGIGAPIFVEAQVRAFVTELETFYRTRARSDAVVTGPEIAVDLARGVARVKITVAEGHVHMIRFVAVSETLRTLLGADLPKPPTGKPHEQVETHAYRYALRKALREIGYPNPRVEIVTTPVVGPGYEVSLTVTGEPGQRAMVAKVAVAGNVKTVDGVILGKLDLRTGDRYEGSKIDDALRRLYTTGLFRKVEIQEVPVDGDPTRLALVIQVEENDSRSVEILAGYGSYEQLRGGVRLEDRNLFGTGRGAALDTKVSMKGYSTGLTLTDPDFLATRSTLTLNGEYFRREEPAFTDEALGGTLALTRPVVDKLTARVGYTYRDRTDPSAFTSLPQDQLVDFTEAKVFCELRHDRRDNLLFPKAGHAEFLAFERITPALGADVDLDRLTFRASWHLPLWSSIRLVLRTEQNLVFAHEGSARVPLQERWFNGGENSVRSFSEAELGPKDSVGRPIGGEYRNLIGAELRFPLWETLEGALFTDAGNVGRKVQDFSLRDLGYGIGGGLRLLLPIGPVRVDAAWNPDQQPGDVAWTVHLSVGYAF